MSKLLRLMPEYRDYVWGGQRLRPGQLTAEAWVVSELDVIAAGPLAGKTLAEAARELGAQLLGQKVMARTGTRFPILIKVLDCNEWLSIQVHPNDEQAVQMEGPGHFGKTEAWHILQADTGAQLIAGARAGTTAEALARSIRDGTIEQHVAYHAIHTGDTVFMPAGTLHALGPGLLVYEVQETSDITYRVFDWNRPLKAGRALHIEQAIAVADPRAAGQLQPPPDLNPLDRRTLIACPYFTLDILAAQADPLTLNTHGESFQAITIIEGRGAIECEDERVELKRLETVLIAANAGVYRLDPIGPVRALRAGVDS